MRDPKKGYAIVVLSMLLTQSEYKVPTYRKNVSIVILKKYDILYIFYLII